MAKLSASQIAQLTYNAGWRGVKQQEAIAIVLAESGGDTTARNVNSDGSNDLGIWQINSIHGYSDADRMDPIKATQIAWTLSNNGSTWQPWVAYLNGRYLQFMDTAKSVLSTIVKKFFPIVGYTGKINLHWGSNTGAADLFAPEGTPVVAMVDGTATARNDGIGGYSIMLQGVDGLKYYYAHLQQMGVSGAVKAGQVIGKVGETGNAAGTGAHLHIGIGKQIYTGTGPQGGAGDINVTQLLTDLLASPGGGGAGGSFGGDEGGIGGAFDSFKDFVGGLISGPVDSAQAGIAAVRIVGNVASYFTNEEKRPILIMIVLGTGLTFIGLRSMAERSPEVNVITRPARDAVNIGKKAVETGANVIPAGRAANVANSARKKLG